jgi:hypothetical protein
MDIKPRLSANYPEQVDRLRFIAQPDTHLMKTLFAPALSAFVVLIAGFAASSLHAAEPEPKPSLGACVCNGVPEQVRRDFINAYLAEGPTSTDKLGPSIA